MRYRHPVNRKHHVDATRGQRLADAIAVAIGSWRFLILQSLVVLCWVALNLLVLFHWHWDPYPFILLNLAFSTQAAYAGPVLLLAGNRQAQRDRDTLEHTYADTERLLAEIDRNTRATLAIARHLQCEVDQ